MERRSPHASDTRTAGSVVGRRLGVACSTIRTAEKQLQEDCVTVSDLPACIPPVRGEIAILRAMLDREIDRILFDRN